MEGLLGVGSDGSIAWINAAAARLLGVSPARASLNAEELFGCDMHALAALTGEHAAKPHRLANGLNVWLLARMQAADGARQVFKLGGSAPPAAATARTLPSPASVPATTEVPAAAATLRAKDRQLIEQTLRACGGNVSRAARQLGVSRGLVYRHLRPPRPA
jgi:DNA-binding NtrC family response regulator